MVQNQVAVKPISICNTNIHPGEVAHLALPLPEQYSCSPLYMPIKVIHGKKSGPVVLIFSTVNGCELNGIEITNRIVEMVKPDDISGTIIAIPVLNVYGLIHYPAMTPSGKRLSDCFPGSEDGSFGERIAHLFTHEILKKADYCIELLTGAVNHDILPQVYCNFDNKELKQLAKAFQSPVVTNVTLENNPFRQTTEDLQIPLLVYQGGEALRFDENAIQLGVEGIQNVMRTIDMLPKSPQTEINPIFSQDEDWIVAHTSGIMHPTVTLGQVIKKNEVIAKVSDPFGASQAVAVKAPQDGVVVGINSTPLIHEGLQIMKIASFLDYEKAENIIEQWDKNQPDSYISN